MSILSAAVEQAQAPARTAAPAGPPTDTLVDPLPVGRLGYVSVVRVHFKSGAADYARFTPASGRRDRDIPLAAVGVLVQALGADTEQDTEQDTEDTED